MDSVANLDGTLKGTEAANSGCKTKETLKGTEQTTKQEAKKTRGS
jgi:hypothetical protein